MSQRFSVESELFRIDTGLVANAQKEWGDHTLAASGTGILHVSPGSAV